jgi:uncharacterized protein
VKQLANDESYLGDVQDVSGTTVSIAMSAKSLTGFVYIDGQGYRAGQIGSFVRIPIGFDNLFGIVSQVGASAVPVTKIDSVDGNRWMTIQLAYHSTQRLATKFIWSQRGN